MNKLLILFITCIYSINYGVTGLETRFDNSYFDINSEIVTKSITLINNNNSRLDLLISFWEWNKKEFNNRKHTKRLSSNKKYISLQKHSNDTIVISYQNTPFDRELFYLIEISQSIISSKDPRAVPSLMIPITVKNSMLDEKIKTSFITIDSKHFLKVTNIGNSLNLQHYTLTIKKGSKTIQSIKSNQILASNDTQTFPLTITSLSNDIYLELKKEDG